MPSSSDSKRSLHALGVYFFWPRTLAIAAEISLHFFSLSLIKSSSYLASAALKHSRSFSS